MSTTSKADEIEFGPEDVGRMVKRGGYFIVCCAACGGRKACADTVSQKMATRALGAVGWSNRTDGRWRCGRCRR